MNQRAEPLCGTAGMTKRFLWIEPTIPISIRWDGGSKQTAITRGSCD